MPCSTESRAASPRRRSSYRTPCASSCRVEGPRTRSRPRATRVRPETPRKGERMLKARVIVMLKSGVLDPQGRAVKGGLHSMGYEEVQDVRVGKEIVLTLGEIAEEKAK